MTGAGGQWGVRARDFAPDVLEDLYAYPRKRLAVAWLLWAAAGWGGAHRFYVERTGTGILMLFTGGGGMFWWLFDASRVARMVREYNAEQARREERGEPPIQLAFMPARTAVVLHDAPVWAQQWHARGRARTHVRLAGDLLVLLFAATSLGVLARAEGVLEGALAVVVLTCVIMLGGYAGQLDDVPVLASLLRWSHRLRLFYYFNRPGSPPALLVRSITGAMLAPFQQRERAEVRLYLEIGASFEIVFITLDILQDIALPVLTGGPAAVSLLDVAADWAEEAFMTFVVTYAFAAPVGAVLTLYLLTARTHMLPRLLGALTLLLIGCGVLMGA